MAGCKTWMIADCYWPAITTPGEYVSHESICVLNIGDEDAVIKLTLYYEDREPIEGFVSHCDAKRTHHIRMDKITDADGNHIPQGVPYAAFVESNVEIIAQYSRIDTTQVNMSFATTMGIAI